MQAHEKPYGAKRLNRFPSFFWLVTVFVILGLHFLEQRVVDVESVFRILEDVHQECMRGPLTVTCPAHVAVLLVYICVDALDVAFEHAAHTSLEVHVRAVVGVDLLDGHELEEIIVQEVLVAGLTQVVHDTAGARLRIELLPGVARLEVARVDEGVDACRRPPLVDDGRARLVTRRVALLCSRLRLVSALDVHVPVDAAAVV